MTDGYPRPMDAKDRHTTNVDPAGPFYAFFGVRHYLTKIKISTKFFFLQGSILEKCDFFLAIFVLEADWF